MEIQNTTCCKCSIPLKYFQYDMYDGSVKTWFKEGVIALKHETDYNCWCTSEGTCHCQGQRKDISMPLALPIILMLDVQPCLNTGTTVEWNFLWNLLPSTLDASWNNQLIYDLVGRGLYNPITSHFIVCYARDKVIYAYDGMQHEGFSFPNQNARLTTHLYGNSIEMPPGFETHYAIYHLQEGPKAQLLFYQTQLAMTHMQYHLEFSCNILDNLSDITLEDSDFLHLNDSECWWKMNPYLNRTSEYILQPTKPEVSLPSKNTTQPTTDTRQSVTKEQLSLDAEMSSPFRCCCEIQGDGYILENIEQDGPAIQCNMWNDWSYIACQREGRASHLHPKTKFICDFCSFDNILPTRQAKQASERW